MIHRFFIGRPPANIEKFIIDNYYASHASEKTVVKYNNGSIVEYDIQGELKSDSIPNKTDIAKLRIGNIVNSISDNAFSNCNSLTDVIINGNNTIIGENAFENCNNISKIKIGDLTLEEIS